jgi:hypothetical protein
VRHGSWLEIIVELKVCDQHGAHLSEYHRQQHSQLVHNYQLRSRPFWYTLSHGVFGYVQLAEVALLETSQYSGWRTIIGSQDIKQLKWQQEVETELTYVVP